MPKTTLNTCIFNGNNSTIMLTPSITTSQTEVQINRFSPNGFSFLLKPKEKTLETNEWVALGSSKT